MIISKALQGGFTNEDLQNLQPLKVWKIPPIPKFTLLKFKVCNKNKTMSNKKGDIC